MYIFQKHLENLRRFVSPGRVVIVYGARRVGKTTLINKFRELEKDSNTLFLNGDDIAARQYLESQSINKLRDFMGNASLLIIDEAQYVKNIGLNLKLIVDHLKDLRIIVTGSSSFELANDVGEPLTGRKLVLKLFPLSQMELAETEKMHETDANLESRLIYGSYPEVVITSDNRFREEYLREMISSYLFKDILAFEGIRYSDKIIRLLQLLAFQIGREVSMNELGKQLGMSKNTVEKYVDLLEKVFVIFKRRGFSRNLRKEISKTYRYYFLDNGIRNALINNFNPLSLRNDTGELWENYIVTERLKKLEYTRAGVNSYFWRTYDKKEIDIVEEGGGKLSGFEIKWNDSRAKAPKDWYMNYPDAGFEVVNRSNYIKFIT